MNQAMPGADGARRSRERAAEELEAALREREAAVRSVEHALQERAALMAGREAELVRREDEVTQRAQEQDAADTSWAQSEEDNKVLRELNEHLVFVTLEAQELRDAAELARNRQEEFLAMLAHELRNPLGPIRNAVEILSRLTDAQPVPRPILDIIRRQVRHMVRLVDDLLDVARVTQGKVTLERQPTAISEFIRRAVEATHDPFNERNQRLSVDLPADPLFVNGDVVRLAQVFSNLLQNACKYTPLGGAIAVRAERVEKSVVIRVIDNGVGIAAGMLAHVFDLFAQDERTIDRSQGGLGIGLTVVRRLVELHGGTVRVRSDGRGAGSEFTVILPLIDQEREPPFVASAISSLAPIAGRILVIEDNVEAGETLAELLVMSGHEVKVALDGRAGLELYETFRPQVVLCDIGLPGMDGYEVAIRMRERRPTRRPTMVALTGYGSQKDHERSLAAGFDHHVVKPSDPDALLRLIDAAMRAESWMDSAPDRLTGPGKLGPNQRERRR